jgi:hypothetical protein
VSRHVFRTVNFRFFLNEDNLLLIFAGFKEIIFHSLSQCDQFLTSHRLDLRINLIRHICRFGSTTL